MPNSTYRRYSKAINPSEFCPCEQQVFATSWEQEMGLAQRNTQRNIYPDAGGYAPESSGKDATTQSFNGIEAIHVHLDHVARLEDYLCARTKVIPDIPLSCYSECLVAQWLHSECGKECVDREVRDAVCKRCEEFHEIAAQSVLLTKRDMPEPASEIVQSAGDLDSAASSFQTALAELHIECRFNQ